MPEGGVGTAAGFIVYVEGGVVPHLHLIQDFLSAHTHSSMVNVVVVLHVTIVMKKFGPILMGYILCTEGIPDTGYPAKKMAGYPANSVSGATLFLIPFREKNFHT